jgi:hypothetical protein
MLGKWLSTAGSPEHGILSAKRGPVSFHHPCHGYTEPRHTLSLLPDKEEVQERFSIELFRANMSYGEEISEIVRGILTLEG